MVKKFLVTGGAGFIGSYITEALSKIGEVSVLDNLRSGYRKNLEGIPHTFIEESVENAEALMEASKGMDTIVHLGALISVPESMEKPFETQSINTVGTLNVLEAARKNGVRKVIFAASAAAYGDDPVMPKTEVMRPVPLSPYAVTKLDGEYYCSIYSRSGWVDATALRFFNVFGPRQDPASKYAAAIPIFINRALKGEDITIFGDGEQTRDFVYVEDVAAACLWVMDKGKGEVFNVSGGQVISINKVAEDINRMCGNTSKIVHLPERPGDIKHSRASIDKLKATGFKIAHDRDASIEKTFRYYQGVQGKQ